MEKVRFAVYFTLLVLTGTTQIKSDAGLKSYGGSRYTFYGSNGTLYTWNTSRASCESSGCDLVSIESREEWKFLKKTIQNIETPEYFIGLRKDASTREWRWLSDNSTVNASSKGEWHPWAAGEPNNQGGENCAEMYNFENNFGSYNDMGCNVTKERVGFICECKDEGENKSAKATASIRTGLTDESQASTTSRVRKLTTTASTTQTKLYSSKPLSTLQHGPTFDLSTEGTMFGNTVTEYPLADDVQTSKLNLVVIMVVLLAIFILILVIAFGLIFFRRHRSHLKQCEDRLTCTFERSSSVAQTSLDPVLVQQTQGFTELTVHLNLSRTESELATYEKVSECIKECEYDEIDDTHRKSRSVSEDSLDVQERARKNTMVSGERGIEQPPSCHDEKDENKDHVYVAVRKHGIGRALSGSRALKKPPSRPQRGTSRLPVNRASCVGLEEYTKNALNETPQASENAAHLYEVVNKTKKKDHVYTVVHEQRKGRARSEASALIKSPGRPQKGTGGLPVNQASCVGIEDYTKASINKTTQAGENPEYLYAVVDKTNKIKKTPQVPAPYRGLAYTVLVHSPENSD